MRRIFLISFVVVFFALASFGAPAPEDFNPLFFPSLELPKRAEKPFLGIFMSEVPEEKLPQGVKKDSVVYIDRVMKESAAQKAGLKKGDIVVAVDGEPIVGGKKGGPVAVLRRAIRKKKEGETIRLTILRGGERFDVQAVLGAMVKIPAPERPHPGIKKVESAYSKEDSALYRLLSKSGRLDDFLNTLSWLRDWSFYPDSYRLSDENPLRLGEINHILKNPLDIVPLAREISDNFLGPAGRDPVDIPGVLRAAVAELDGPVNKEITYPETFNGLEDTVSYMVERLSSARSIMDEAFSGLTNKELESIKSIQLPPMPDNGEKDWEAFLGAAAKVDYSKLLEALEEAALAISPPVIESLERWSKNLPANTTRRKIDTPAGEVIIGGTGPDRYRKGALIIIDPAGDDIYTAGAGASDMKNPFSVVIDLGGDDLYISYRGRTQGSGFMGMGAVVDISGSDTYLAGSASQGSGVLGAGILIDLKGDDYYSAGSFCQGAGFLGAGILVDGEGDDRYGAQFMAQGFGSIRGLGALLDLSGDDRYSALGRYSDIRDPQGATMSLSQGFSMGLRPYDTPLGAPGGIGMLIDRKGDDRYTADHFSQGGGYWYSFGLLSDLSGDDTYNAGRYSQGAGVHISAGLLMDQKGRDSYTVDIGVSQGTGHDFGLGVLFDGKGPDTYRGGFLSQGRATCGSIGILYDRDGGNTFYAKEKGRGSTEADDSCGARGFGLILR